MGLKSRNISVNRFMDFIRIMRKSSRFISALSGIVFALIASSAAADQIEIGDGVYVSRKSYRAPANEQPFYGFIKKSPPQLEADKTLTEQITKKGYSKSYAFNRAMLNGWRAVGSGKLDLAARRFNQAYLIDPSQSAIFQAFAVVAHLRFRDDDYAEELFSTGARMNNRPPGYMADYGRFMLVIGKPREALPILEEAVRDFPSNPTAWSNLAFARLKDGQRDRACDAINKSARLKPPANVAGDLKILVAKAKCG